jgi:SH3-like domain-containing protein
MRVRNVLLAAAAVGLAAAPSGTKTLTVQYRTTTLRAVPAYVSLKKPIAKLPYGTPVTVLVERGSWVQVRDPDGRVGWLNRSALTSKRLVLRAGDERVATTTAGDEVGLATKGFDPKVEAEFRKKHPDLDFAWVDRMEKIVISHEQLAAFAKEGNLALAAGGAE